MLPLVWVFAASCSIDAPENIAQNAASQENAIVVYGKNCDLATTVARGNWLDPSADPACIQPSMYIKVGYQGSPELHYLGLPMLGGIDAGRRVPDFSQGITPRVSRGEAKSSNTDMNHPLDTRVMALAFEPIFLPNPGKFEEWQARYQEEHDAMIAAGRLFDYAGFGQRALDDQAVFRVTPIVRPTEIDEALWLRISATHDYRIIEGIIAGHERNARTGGCELRPQWQKVHRGNQADEAARWRSELAATKARYKAMGIEPFSEGESVLFYAVPALRSPNEGAGQSVRFTPEDYVEQILVNEKLYLVQLAGIDVHEY